MEDRARMKKDIGKRKDVLSLQRVLDSRVEKYVACLFLFGDSTLLFFLVSYSPLRADVLLLHWHAGHLPQPHPHLDVSELQAQVLPQDGDSGSPLPRTRLWEQLEEEEEMEVVEELEEEDEEEDEKRVEEEEDAVELVEEKMELGEEEENDGEQKKAKEVVEEEGKKEEDDGEEGDDKKDEDEEEVVGVSKRKRRINKKREGGSRGRERRGGAVR